MYAPRGRGRGHVSYTFLLRVTKKGVGVNIAGKIAYVLNGRPLTIIDSIERITEEATLKTNKVEPARAVYTKSICLYTWGNAPTFSPHRPLPEYIHAYLV